MPTRDVELQRVNPGEEIKAAERNKYLMRGVSK